MSNRQGGATVNEDGIRNLADREQGYGTQGVIDVKRFFAGIVLGIALAASAAYAQESTGRMLTGRDFRTLPERVRTFWMHGWMTGFAQISWSGSPVIAACLAKKKPTVEELRRRLDQHIATHSAEASRPLPVMLVDAMEELCR